MENYPFLAWAQNFAIAFLGLLGVAKILEGTVNRFWKKRDDRAEIHATNQGKQIEADAAFSQKIIDEMSKRLERLEEKFETLQKEYNSQVKMSAQIEAENRILKEKEKTQEGKIQELQKEVHKLSTENINLKNDLQRTQNDLDHYKREFDSLKRDFEAQKK